MIWYKDLYVGESIVHKTKKVKWKIMHNAGQIGIYVITLASNTQNLLDIIPSYELMQKGYPKKDMVVVGLAKGYDEAIEVAASIVVYEETGVKATLMKYIGKSQYSFTVPEDVVEKTVHWYLMMADSYYSKPQREEYFVDSGYYKYHEAYHLLKFPNEKQMLERAYEEYQELKKNNLWGSHRYE